jgi:phosphatidylinositol-3-phosphatase
MVASIVALVAIMVAWPTAREGPVQNGENHSRNGVRPPDSSAGSRLPGFPPRANGLSTDLVPTVVGVPQVRHELSATAPHIGSGSQAFAYQWLRCDAHGTGCAPIPAATRARYMARGPDAGHRIRVRAWSTASGSAIGGLALTSNPTQVVLPAPIGPCGSLASQGKARIQHVVWIWFENKDYDYVVGNDHAPYLNELATQCGVATNFFSVAHVSRRDYIASTGGEIRPPLGDIESSGYSRNARSVFEQGISWKAYMESMPGNCYAGDFGHYDHGHNPPIFYGRIRADCLVFDVPMGTTSSGALTTDLTANSLPQLSIISPNECFDMHEFCGKGEGSADAIIGQGDRWLQKWIPLITASADYRNGRTVIFVTFDEGFAKPATLNENCLQTLSDDCHILTVVIAPHLNGVRVGRFFTLYSLLRTTEEIFGLPLLGHAADPDTNSMREAFGI